MSKLPARLSPLYRRGNQGSERLNNLPQITQVTGGRVRCRPKLTKAFLFSLWPTTSQTSLHIRIPWGSFKTPNTQGAP